LQHISNSTATKKGEKMLNSERKIAVRFYNNNSYGTTFGKGLYRKALYNGTVTAIDSNETYLVDFYTYDDWANMAKTDEDMEILATVTPSSNALYSWIKHYDRGTRAKSSVAGICEIDTVSFQVGLLICDEQHGITESWRLNARPCKQVRSTVKSPQLLATNTDLGSI
jgi:hypothetical protein